MKCIDIPAPYGYNGGEKLAFGVKTMTDTYSVPLKTLVKEFNLEVTYASTDFDAIRITVEDVARPGLQLAGYFDHYEPMRLQVMGNVEMSYVDKLQPKERGAIFDRLFSYKFPALLIARDIPPHAECLQMAQKHNVTVLRTKEATSTIVSTIITYLKAALAPRITRHGVLVEVYGEGILLIGDSGIGKSEAAVELLKRGHRLIADDAVEIRKVSTNSLVGTAPELIRNYIELRGIGIVNVAKLFGMGAVRTENEINLIVNIVPWNTQEVYDRLGLEEQYMELLGVKVPMNTIPITPGRNLAMILEVAAMNNRQKKLGYNAALELTDYLVYLPKDAQFYPAQYLKSFTWLGEQDSLAGGLPTDYSMRTRGTVQTGYPGVYTVEYRVTFTDRDEKNPDFDRKYTGYSKLIVVVEG